MKVKRQKQNRRIVRFYKTCYGFHEPFKVLCDGNFVHKVVTSPPLGNVEEALAKVLGSHVKALVTSCATAELRRLGPAFNATTKVAQRMLLAKCKHEKPVLAADCIQEMISESKGEHFFVASQDLELRKHLRKVPGVGLVFAKRDALVLEPPSDASQNVARNGEAKRLGVGEEERRLIEEREAQKQKMRALQEAAAIREGLVLPRRVPAPLPRAIKTVAVERLEDEDAEISGRDVDGEEDEGGSEDAAEKALEEKVKEVLAAALKRKRPRRPKGPNPLSVKKKKESTGKGPAAAAAGKGASTLQASAASTEGARRRRRKRHHKAGATDNAGS